MWRRARSADENSAPERIPVVDPRLAQLKLVHDELNRQRDATAAKHQSMYQRAALLIGASGLVTGVQAARIPAAVGRLIRHLKFPPSTDLQIVFDIGAVAFATIATATAVLAAVWGLRTMWVEKGSEIDVQKLAINVLSAEEPDLYAAEWSLLADKLGVHAEDNDRLEGKRKVFVTGAIFLVLAWVAAIVQFALSF